MRKYRSAESSLTLPLPLPFTIYSVFRSVLNLIEDAVNTAVDNSVQMLPRHLLGPQAVHGGSDAAQEHDESYSEGQSFFRQVAGASTSLTPKVVSLDEAEHAVEEAAGKRWKKAEKKKKERDTKTLKETKAKKTKKTETETRKLETKMKKTETKMKKTETKMKKTDTKMKKTETTTDKDSENTKKKAAEKSEEKKKVKKDKKTEEKSEENRDEEEAKKVDKKKVKQKAGKSEIDDLEREDLLKTLGKQVSEKWLEKVNVKKRKIDEASKDDEETVVKTRSKARKEK